MINSKSLKKEIYSAFLESQNEIEILRKEIEILQNVQKTEILTIDDFGNDFVNRCEIHDKEFKFFIQDLKFAAEFIASKIKEVKRVELPSFIK